tara:strand:- start:76 stop:1119 length:1044 start_codon:yes stop_codon:yes gene_type:complete
MILKIQKKKYDLTIKPFVIAEIGHNHQGSLKLAKEMILKAKECGADAVKFQKRDNKNLFTKKLYDQSYDNANSYGDTYGSHREVLEFGKKEYKAIIKYANSINIIAFATPFDFNSLIFLEDIGVSLYKIASADLTNTPLIEEIAKKNKPIFLSTGGGKIEDIKRAVKSIEKFHKKLIILHCTAAYPVELNEMNLRVITKLKKLFPKYIIGLSDHENGIDAASIAFMLGARVFEKHFTLNHAWKGTDNSFSLEPNGLRKMIRNLNRIPLMLGDGNKKIYESEKNALKKMSKSIVASKNLKKNHVIKLSDITFKSPGGGMKPFDYKKIINKRIKKDIQKDEIFTYKMIY